MENPVRPPELSDERLAQMRRHLLGELDRRSRRRERWRRFASVVTSRRRLLVALVAALMAILAVSAVGADKRRSVVYWLFDRSPETYPLVQAPTVGEWFSAERMGIDYVTRPGIETIPKPRAVHVLHGTSAGHRWEMQVFFKKWSLREVLGVGLSPGGTPKAYYGTDIPGIDGVHFGAPVHGISEERGVELHWVGAGVSVPGRIEPTGGGTGPKWLFGPANPSVRQVDLESNDGTIVRVPTFPGPDDLRVPARFWVAVLRLDHIVNTVVPRDENGEALEHWRLEMAL